METLVKLVKDAEGKLHRADNGALVEGAQLLPQPGGKPFAEIQTTRAIDERIAEEASAAFTPIIPRTTKSYFSDKKPGEGTPENPVYKVEFYDRA